MKLAIASDIHGSATWCARLLEAVEAEHPDRIVLLGDLLYHGPRNDLPDGYAPKEVMGMLNPLATQIVAVRGNCEAEVDQMVLDFPCMADYAVLLDPSVADDFGRPRELFATHGHVFGPGLHGSAEHMPPLPAGSALLYGHTHVKVSELRDGVRLFNPGSVSIPKDGTHSFGVYEDGSFRHVLLG